MMNVFSLADIAAPLAEGTCKLRGKEIPIRVLSSRESTFIRDELLGRPIPPVDSSGDSKTDDPTFVKNWTEFTRQAALLDLAAAIGWKTAGGWTFRLPAGASRHGDRVTWAALVDEGGRWRKETLEEWGEHMSDTDLAAIRDAYFKLARTDVVAAAVGNSSEETTPPAS